MNWQYFEIICYAGSATDSFFTIQVMARSYREARERCMDYGYSPREHRIQ